MLPLKLAAVALELLKPPWPVVPAPAKLSALAMLLPLISRAPPVFTTTALTPNGLLAMLLPLKILLLPAFNMAPLLTVAPPLKVLAADNCHVPPITDNKVAWLTLLSVILAVRTPLPLPFSVKVLLPVPL